MAIFQQERDRWDSLDRMIKEAYRDKPAEPTPFRLPWATPIRSIGLGYLPRWAAARRATLDPAAPRR